MQNLTGVYQCAGDQYHGVVIIRKWKKTYFLEWDFGEAIHHGVAMLASNILSASWPGGLVVYQVEQGKELPGQIGPKLNGYYTSFSGNGVVYKEALTYVKPLHPLPQPREWQVGDYALVNWSHDVYWYPATIDKKHGDRYYVLFDDGDEEWTTAECIIPEDIAVGDRVYGDWQGNKEYYPGRVTRRKDEQIHIQYEDGDDETTTVSRVRVLRPKADDQIYRSSSSFN